MRINIWSSWVMVLSRDSSGKVTSNLSGFRLI